ncbi:MAG: oligosaccharide flippase family protein [Chloroflexota bacterium]|nr:oligosaccharide flippase family protein [Chloroflexota bacterium]MDQ6905834.1 oligosaccharide flippase family protein [Chloroflexota bacterium]
MLRAWTVAPSRIVPTRGGASVSVPAPPRALSLRANFSWTFIGNIVYAACQWAMLVVLAKLGSPEVVGQFALGLAITAPVILLTNLQLRAVQATDARREYAFGDYLGLRLVVTPLALLAIATITFVSGYGWQTALVILLVGLAKVFESISDVFYGLLQQHERMDRIAISMMIKGPLSLAALTAAIAATGSIVWGAAALAAVWAIRLVTYDMPSGAAVLHATRDEREQASIRPRWKWRLLAKLTWLALPLGFVMMLGSLMTNIPRYFIERFQGTHELGIFAAMAYIVIAGTTVVDALGQAASPRLARLYADGEIGAFRTLAAKVLGISVLLGAAGVLLSLVVGRQVLTLLYRPEYAEHLDVFIWVIAAAGIGYVASVFGYALTAARQFTIQVPVYTVSIVVVVIGCALFVPSHGILGAAWATFLMFAVQLPLKSAVVLYALRKRATLTPGPLPILPRERPEGERESLVIRGRGVGMGDLLSERAASGE